jgi:hypothetical protein
MRNVATMAAVLVALVGPAWAQQAGKDLAGSSSKSAAPEPCEIRAYLLDKERATVNIVGITAMLIVEGKDGVELLIPLQVITTKTGEKTALRSSRTPRELEGTAYSVSLVTVPSAGSRRSEAGDADRRTAKDGPSAPTGKKQDAPADCDNNEFTLEGPYFMADLTREQLAAFTCKASVRFAIKGANHMARGFSCTISKGSSQGSMCKPMTETCAQLERHLQANEMDKARADLDHLSASLTEPCSEAACQHARHGCASCCTELRAAVSAGNREKALEALHALKSNCSPCAAPDKESKTNGDRK